MPKRVILVVEDEPAIRRGLVDALRFAGFDVTEAADGAEAHRAAFSPRIDLILLDLMLPKKDGFSILNDVRRARPTLPVIILTARGAEEDRVRGLKAGADDYVVKPFSAREVLARVEAVLRRSAERPRAVRSLRFGETCVDLERREVRRAGGARQQISEREAAILGYLAANPGRAISRRELLQRLWGIQARFCDTRTIDMHVARLREKLEEDAASPRVILTVHSKGYMIAASMGPREAT